MGKIIKWFITIVLGLIILSIILSLFLVFKLTNNFKDMIENLAVDFDTCAALGYPVLESYPRKCRAPNEEIFIEDIGNELEKTDLIRINNPRPNQEITSPLEIKGEARGAWFFEASFPIKLLDADNKVIAIGHAEAQSEWMTEEFVPFKGTLEFSTPQTLKGKLILEKDNPSGLPEYADQLEIPVKFN